MTIEQVYQNKTHFLQLVLVKHLYRKLETAINKIIE